MIKHLCNNTCVYAIEFETTDYEEEISEDIIVDETTYPFQSFVDKSILVSDEATNTIIYN